MINFKQSTNFTEVKRFVLMCSWYRRFIPHFANLISSINGLIKFKKKGQKVVWNFEAEEAFKKVKKTLISTPILSSPDFTKPFSIQCDASSTGLGAVLNSRTKRR